jgi:predicted transcriptional regulator
MITARVDGRLTDVIALMKSNDISQVPVVTLDGNIAGLVTEVDLLKHMFEANHTHSADETIASILQQAKAVYPAYTLLEEVLPSIIDGSVILVTEGSQPAGILTKIDILDFIAQEL